MHHLVGMAEIAEMLGVSRQRVAQLIETYEDFPKPEVELSGGRVWSRTAIESWIASHPEREAGRPEEGKARVGFFGTIKGGLFSRFTDRARNSIVKAQEEARLLNHNYIGTEHLLLGLIAIHEGLAWQVLGSLGVSHDDVWNQVLAEIGRGSEIPQGHIPFTPRAKKVLQVALREAKQLGHNYIGTEHVLLALVRETDGVAWQSLEKVGLTQKATRAAIIAVMSGVPLAPPAPSEAVCSFCSKTRGQVKSLVAGPDSIAICDECIRNALEIADSEAPMNRIAELERRIARLEEDS